MFKVVLLLLVLIGGVDELKVQPGDILLTRNFGGEEANPSPGYYNHIAIIAEDDWVIESQQIFDSVIAVPVWYFFDRYPEVLVLRPKDRNIAKASAIYATKVMGRRYSKYESIRPFWRWHGGDNCVSTVKRIYNGIGVDRKWIIPDDLYKDIQTFTPISIKRDYEHYVTPVEPYKGKTTQRWDTKK